MKKKLIYIAAMTLLLVVGSELFNHIHAWLGVAICLCAIYPIYKLLKLLKNETEI